jgi:DNA polymerase-1
MGSGKVPADIMIVAEVPGYKEDAEGAEPLMGSAGKLLSRYLTKAGIKRSDCYITSAVKCRTEDGKPPSKTEIQACQPYLAQEIEIVKPKVIITLGNTALQTVTKRSGIMKWRGTPIDYSGSTFTSTVIATLHPAAALRNPRFEPLIEADIWSAARIINGDGYVDDNFNFVYVNSKDKLKAMIFACKESPFLTVDTENMGFDYWRHDKRMLCMSITTCMSFTNNVPHGIVTWGLPVAHAKSPWRKQHGQVMALFKELLETLRVVGQNFKYDSKWFLAKYGIDIQEFADTMLMSHILDENTPNGLEFLAQSMLGANPYKGKFNFDDNDPIYELTKYCGQDTYYDCLVYGKLRTQLSRTMRPAGIYGKITKPGAHAFRDIEYSGLYIDPQRLKERTEECKKKIAECEEKLNGFLLPRWKEKYLKVQMKTKVKWKPMNWNSPKLFGAFLYDEDGLGLTCPFLTESGAPSTAENALIELMDNSDHPALKIISDYRLYKKYLSTYLDPWADGMDENNCIHFATKIHGTVTGRLASEIHTIPRDDFIRGLVGAPPGWTYVEADYSQVELRIVAFISREPTMIRIFQLGEDIHRRTAAQIMGIPEDQVSKDDRKKAKAVNFGFVYGMGWRKFKVYAKEKYGVVLTDEEAKLYRERFFKLYPGLLRWHRKCRKLVNELKYMVSPIGRIRHLTDVDSADEGVQAEAERQAINSPVQGFGSDINFVSLIRLWRMMKPVWHTEARINLMVHDAEGFYIKNEYINKWLPIIKNTMEDMSTLKDWFNCEIDIPIEVEIEYGSHWGADCKVWHGEEVA